MNDMNLFDVIMTNIFRAIFFGWLIYGSWSWRQVFKSDKYLAVKEMDKQVRISKLDLKFEYKMAKLNYKSTRDKR